WWRGEQTSVAWNRTAAHRIATYDAFFFTMTTTSSPDRDVPPKAGERLPVTSTTITWFLVTGPSAAATAWESNCKTRSGRQSGPALVQSLAAVFPVNGTKGEATSPVSA